jgi:Mg/Co/Ni transporter MgtE
MLYGFIRTVTGPDAVGIGIVLLGAVVWQTATVINERSPLLRRLAAVSVRHTMATTRTSVPAWWKISSIRKRLGDLDPNSFFLVTRDGYTSGVALPDDVYQVSREDAGKLSIGQLAHPIGYLDAVRPEDALLEAFTILGAPRLAHVPVLDERGALVGIITRRHIEGYLRTGANLSKNTHGPHSLAEPPSLASHPIAA